MKQYVVLSHSFWSSTPSRIQQLVTRIGDAEILFFQPAKNSEDKSYKNAGKLVRPNITLYTLPPDGPLNHRIPFLENHSVRKQAAFIEKKARRHGFQQPILWLTTPDQLPFLDRLSFRGLIYDCDRFWPSTLDERESELAYAADVIFAASPLLKRRLSPCSSNIALVPNGVNYPMFSRNDHPIPSDLSGLLSPILGWVGTIDATLDLSPVQAIADRHPEWTVALVGPIEDCPAVRRLATYSNVVFLGVRSMVDLPDYLTHFQILLHLRRKGEENSDVIPSRIYEYLSTGRPVVSLLLPDEVEEFPDVIYGAHDPAEFVRLCEKALLEDPSWVARRRKDYGAAAAWSNRADTIRQILNAISL